MYKTETHIHTRESSACSFAYAKDLVYNLKKINYSTAIITDHYSKYYFDLLKLKKLKEQIEYLDKGFQAASYYGSKTGLNILRGVELFLEPTQGDYLLFGITKEFLLSYPELYNYSLKDLYDLCQQYDFLLYQAHPFRNQETLVANSEEVDGMEVYNGNHNAHFNELAMLYAEKNNISFISGGDRHWISEDSHSGIVSKKLIKTNDELVEVLKSGEYNLSTGKTPLYYPKQTK